MNNRQSLWRRDIVGWSLYDFANTIYSMNIVSLYLKRYLIEDMNLDDRYFDIPFSISMAFAALLLPALGAVSDRSEKKKIFLLLFTLMCCISVAGIAFIPPAYIFIVILLFVISNFAYEAGQPFYNVLLYSISNGRQARYVSGIGVAFGYVGSVLGMILVMPFVGGTLFGFNIPFIEGSGKIGAFLPTAIMFLAFSIPLFLWVKEKPVLKPGKINLIKAYGDVRDGLVMTRKYPGVLRFLVADYFFEDAVATVVINIGIYCSIVIGLAESEITLFLIISTVSAVAGSFIIGKIAEKWALKPLINIIVMSWVIALIAFVVSDNIIIVWILGSIVGILMGGLLSTTRPMLAELVPEEELGRFFGLFSISGRAAAVMGPLVWTTMVYLFQSDRIPGKLLINIFGVGEDNYDKLPYKMGVLSLVFMMLFGLFLFRKVPHESEGFINGQG